MRHNSLRRKPLTTRVRPLARLLAIAALALLLRPTGTALAGDNNILWDWLYHAPAAGDPATQTVPGQSDKFLNVNGTTVTIYALSDSNDVDSARVRYWDGSEKFATMSKVGTASWNSRTVDVWKATITNAITSGPTYYYIHMQDGTHSAYLKQNNGNAAGGYTNPHGQFVRGDTSVAAGDYSFTASAGPVNIISAPTVLAERGDSGSFNITLANAQAISGGSIVLQYDTTRGVTLSGHAAGGSGANSTLTIAVGTLTAGAGASFAVNFSVSPTAPFGRLALDLTNASSLTGSSNTQLNDGALTVVDPNGVRDVYVQLFEWRWNDIATECTFLAAKGYKGVQISPPNEHILPPSNQSYAWWARYQPVSYRLDQSRSGTLAEFEAMLDTCNAAGIDIVADMVINHMANWADSGVGSAGSSYNALTLSYPGVPYTGSNFHQFPDGTGSATNCKILPGDYTGNAWRVRNCALENLPDLKTDDAATRQVIATYMNALIDMGVKGFRIDGAKHMLPGDLTALRALLSDPNIFIFAEVIDNGGEPITAGEYTGVGYVTEFRYQTAMGNAFTQAGGCPGPNLSWLAGIADGKLPTANALVFTNNHDSQRGHGAAGPCVIDYRDGDGVYNLAQAFMLAHPYGRPVVMSSYHWNGSDDNAGPPTVNGIAGSSGATKPVYGVGQNAGDTPQFCDSMHWVCEHRRAPIANMVAFRNMTFGEPVTNWWDNGGNRIAFGRNGKGFIALNRSTGAHTRTYASGMPAGDYCDVIRGQLNAAGTACSGALITVDAAGNINNLTVNGLDAVAIHIGQRVQTLPAPTVALTAPVDGATHTMRFVARATAAVSEGSIDHVEFFVNNVPVRIDTTAPYTATVTPGDYGPGTHTVRATATANGQTASDSHTFIVPGPPPLTIAVGDYSVAAGGVITVEIAASHNAAPGIGALNVELAYDPTVVTPLACRPDPAAVFDAEFCNLTYAADTLKLNLVAVSGVSGDRALAQIGFQALGATGSSSPLTLAVPTAANPAGAALTVTPLAGSITIGSSAAAGDVNCSGSVDTADALYIGQYDVALRAAGNSCPPADGTLFLPACDVSGDGLCNVIDQLFVLQCDVALPNAFCPAARGEGAARNARLPAQVTGGVGLTIGAHAVAQGGSVNVPVQASVADGAQLGAINVTLQYDSSRFAVLGCTGAAGIDSALCNSSTPGLLRLNALALTGRSGSFDLWQIEFAPLSGATGESPLSFSAVNTLTDTAGNPLTAATSDGRLCIGRACAVPTAVPLAGAPAAEGSRSAPGVMLTLLTVIGLTAALLWLARRRASAGEA